MAVDATAGNDGDAIFSGLGAAFDLEGLFNAGGELKDGEDTWLPQPGSMGDMPFDEEYVLETPSHHNGCLPSSVLQFP
jgi:hypothetical protein